MRTLISAIQELRAARPGLPESAISAQLRLIHRMDPHPQDFQEAMDRITADQAQDEALHAILATSTWINGR